MIERAYRSLVAAAIGVTGLAPAALADPSQNLWKPYAVGGLADLSRGDTIACKPGDTVIDLEDRTPAPGDSFIATVSQVGETSNFGSVVLSVTNDGQVLLAGSNSSLIVAGLVRFHKCTKIG